MKRLSQVELTVSDHVERAARLTGQLSFGELIQLSNNQNILFLTFPSLECFGKAMPSNRTVQSHSQSTGPQILIQVATWEPRLESSWDAQLATALPTYTFTGVATSIRVCGTGRQRGRHSAYRHVTERSFCLQILFKSLFAGSVKTAKTSAEKNSREQKRVEESRREQKREKQREEVNNEYKQI